MVGKVSRFDGTRKRINICYKLTLKNSKREQTDRSVNLPIPGLRKIN